MIDINNKTLCENCFSETDLPVCPHCGYFKGKPSKDQQALVPGTVLNGKYIVGKTIGSGGFGITYLGYNIFEKQKVAIKEYFPKTVVYRKNADTAVMLSNEELIPDFKKGCEAFYSEARTLAKFNGNPTIVGVYEFFYENGTAYFVMEYLRGKELRRHLAENGTLSNEETRKMMIDIASALLITHTIDVLHRDVSDVNIFLCDDGTYKLIDFGSARQYSMEYTKSMSVILNPGFAPLEQYQRHGKQGPWTDIYALGAAAYTALTGKMLDDPMTRLNNDKLVNIKGTNIDPILYRIICKCINVDAKSRYQEARSLINDLRPKVGGAPAPKNGLIKFIAAAAAVVAVLTVGAVAWLNMPKDSQKDPNPVDTDVYWNAGGESSAEDKETAEPSEDTALDAAENGSASESEEHEHTYGNWTASSNGTSHSRICFCGKKQTEPHNFDAGTVTSEPTATTEGVKSYACAKCKVTKTEPIPALNPENAESAHTHAFGSWVDDENGSTHTRACYCGEKNMVPHNFDAGKITKQPTEAAEGVKTFACTVCGGEKSSAIPKLEAVEEPEAESTHTHSFAKWQDGGNEAHERVCSCGEKERENHNFDSGKVTKEPTESAEGVKTYTCTVCGAAKSEAIPKLAHTHSFGNWSKADDKTHIRVCSCGEKESENHKLDSGKVTKEPTEAAEGVMTYTCTVCGATKTETVPVHTHSYSDWSGNGSNHTRSCSCGKTETEAHSYDSGRVTKEPTESAEGVKTYTCTVCGASYTEAIPKNEHIHIYTDWKDNGDGKHTGGCSCKEKLTEAHTYGAGTETTPPTEASEGVMTYTCNKCGAVKTEPIPKLEPKTYLYYCYVAEYTLDGSTVKYMCAPSTDYLIKLIELDGGTLIGEIKYYETVSSEDRGDSFRDRENDRYYYSYDAYIGLP